MTPTTTEIRPSRAGGLKLWLERYPFLPTAEGEFLRALGRHDDAATCFARAFELARTEPEQRFIGRKLTDLRKESQCPTEVSRCDQAQRPP